MAEIICLNDGGFVVNLGDTKEFLERLLREKVGVDAAWCFADYVSELTDDQSDLSTENELLEREIDGYRAMCFDACEALSTILSLLDAPRLDREKLRFVARTTHDDTMSNL